MRTQRPGQQFTPRRGEGERSKIPVRAVALGVFVSLFCLEWLVGPAPASNPPTESVQSTSARQEARRYSDFIDRFVLEVRRQYVREVAEVDLFEAAAQGLYEAARQPLPPHLRDDLQKAWVNEIIYGKYFAAGQPMPATYPEDLRRIGNFQIVMARLRAALGNHEAVRGQLADIASASALKRVLDPYCGFAAAREFRTMFDRRVNSVGVEFANVPMTNELFNTLNVEIPIRNGRVEPAALPERPIELPDKLLVKSVIAGSPAQRAGLRPGDLITRFDNKPCSRMESRNFQRLFATVSPDQRVFIGNQPMGTPQPALRPVKAEVRRGDSATAFTVTLEPDDFEPESVFGITRNPDDTWDFMVDRQAKLGYVRLGSIILQTDRQFRDALKSLQSQQARGMVLDLRWCPGGFLVEAMSVAMSVLPPGTPIARVAYRDPNTLRDEPEPVTDAETDLPIIVLINGETTGGGELIAAALQDHGRAIIAGERTYGKGTVQSSLNQISVAGMNFKITKGMFVRPSGKGLQRFPEHTSNDEWGVRPDTGRWLPLSPESAKQLKAHWILQTLRPAASREALATDDPESDPQLRAALAMLKAKAKH